MQTRREQVRAYRFVNRRVVSAMLSGEPETNDLPMRRLSLGTFASFMLAAIVFAGVGVYGLMRTGGSRPQPHSLIIERETGARYLYLEDGLLYPVVNYTSARLILGADAKPRMMSTNSLRGLPRGRVLGINGAPDSLPDRRDLIGLPWSLCSAPYSADLPTAVSQLIIGPAPQGGTDPGTTALLTASGRPTGTRYLLMRRPNGLLQRTRIESQKVLAALGLAAPPVAVGDALLNGITAGPDLEQIRIPEDGTPTKLRVNGKPAPVGQVSQLDNQYFLTLPNGLVPIGDVTRRLLMGTGARPPVPISGQEAAGARLDVAFEPDGYPTTVPELFRPAHSSPAVCASYHGDGDSAAEITLSVYDSVPEVLRPSDDFDVTAIQRNVRTVDRVNVKGGLGALVRTVPAPGARAAGATIYLITDSGRKYPLSGSAADMAALGYEGVAPVAVPAALLALIPTGPTLDSETARGVRKVTPSASDARTPAAPAPSGSRSSTPVAPGITSSARSASPRPTSSGSR